MDDFGERSLRAGRPATGSVAEGGYLYYKYSVISKNTTSVEFLLTPNTGDSDLYISREKKPSKDEYEKGSHTEAVDRVIYRKGESFDLPSIDHLFHIAVYGKTQSTFSLSVIERTPERNTTVQLLPGHPQKDTLTDEHN
jgi:hypothetical protein